MFAASKTDGVVAGGPPPSGDPYWSNVSLLTNFENNLTFRDESTNNFAITRNGVVNPSLRTPFSGGVGGSEYFNGSTGYLTVPLNAALNPGTGDFTLEYWVYFNALNIGNQYNGQTNGLSIGLDGFNRFNFGQSYVSNLITDTVAATTGQWYHVAVSRSGTTMSMFVNGSRRGSITNSTNFSTTTENRIGWNGGVVYFSGFLSNLRIVKGTAVYDPTLTTLTVPTAPLTAITNTSLLITGTGQGMFNNSTFVDQGPNALTVTATGAPVYSGLSPFGNTYPGSVLFNGSSQYLSAPANVAFDFGSEDWTAECWINTTSLAAASRVMGQIDSTSSPSFTSFVIEVATTGAINVYVPSGGSYASASGPSNISANTWNHIAAVRNGNNIRVYVNGAQGSALSYTASLPSTGQPFVVGRNGSYTTGFYFPGFISNVRIVKGTAVYTANFTPPTTPLTAITNTSLLVRGDTGAFYDLSNNGLAETGVGSPVVTTQVKKFGSESGFFNGSSSYLTVTDSTALKFGSGDFTVEGWYYTGSATNQSLISLQTVSTAAAFRMDFEGATSKIYLLCSTNGTSFAVNISSTAISLNTWTYIAAVRSGTTFTLYINGVSAASTTASGALITSTANYIGCTNVNGSFLQFVTGYLDDIRITKGVARYTANFTPPTATFPTN